MKPTLIFDLDGTLVRCHEYYEAATEAAAMAIAARTGLEESLIIKLSNELDMAAALTGSGFTRHRYPGSLAATSIMADAFIGVDPNWDAAHRVMKIGNEVYDAPYEAYEGVHRLLEAYAVWGWQLVLLTKGEETLQHSKVNKNDLLRYFGTENLVVTQKKNAVLVRTLITRYRMDPARTWIIGDSLRDDIGPAIDAGVGSIWIGSTSTWTYDKVERTPTFRVDHTVELPTVLPYDPQAEGSRWAAKRYHHLSADVYDGE